MTLSLPSSALPVAAPPRGICGRCRQPRAAHGATLLLGACGRYSPAASWPPSVLPPGLVAIVDTREPDHANRFEAHLHRRPWAWNGDLHEEDERAHREAIEAGRKPAKEVEEHGWERLYCVRAMLPAGDYSAAGCVHRILIEWKEPDDLASTLYGAGGENFERFTREISTAFELFPRVRFVIMVPCSVADVLAHRYECNVDPKSVLGRCNRLLLDHGIATIFAGDHGEAERQMGALLRGAWEDERAERKARAAEEAKAR